MMNRPGLEAMLASHKLYPLSPETVGVIIASHMQALRSIDALNEDKGVYAQTLVKIFEGRADHAQRSWRGEYGDGLSRAYEAAREEVEDSICLRCNKVMNRSHCDGEWSWVCSGVLGCGYNT